jgi:ElaA protein
MANRPEHHVWRGFHELNAAELYSLLRLRCEVFVVEQQCPYLDIDGRDFEAVHLLAFGGDDRLSGYLRVFAPTQGDAAAHIGRIVTAPYDRGSGLGRWMVQEALRFIAERHGGVPVKLSAQVYLERFYEGFGFARSSDDYSEDGIMHCDMLRAT